ncbi:hypothetical protein L2E82_47632 [Cichorium intybus]|uniref:Uncharacterized protein n=1 Tax=Cichorium intybus TaxID=13427 RepID=A0ACB8YWK0_CICIN|nr:hypothetical protein L2E82_47632 [Cichorium intybus]
MLIQPARRVRWEDGLADRVEYDFAGKVKTQVVRSPFVQIPLGVTEDRLIGSVGFVNFIYTLAYPSFLRLVPTNWYDDHGPDLELRMKRAAW